jgi:hypothetical protein
MNIFDMHDLAAICAGADNMGHHCWKLTFPIPPM